MISAFKPTPPKLRLCLILVVIGITASVTGWPMLFFVQIAATPLVPLLRSSKVFWYHDKPVYLGPLGGIAASLIYAVVVYFLISLIQAIRSSSHGKG